MQLAEFWFAQACRTALNDAGDNATDRVTLALYLGDEGFHLGRFLRIWAAHGIGFRQLEVVEAVVALEGNVTHLRGIGLNADAQLSEHQFGQRPAHTTADGDTG